MRSRSREINIFNMSMLDVIAGAMGAFLIVMVVLLPSYRKQSTHSPAEIAALEQQLRTAQEELQASRAAAEAETRQQTAAMARLEEQLKKTFLLIHIQWASFGHDVDLHVMDPNGNEFFWMRRTVPGSTGNLSVDSIVGPGNEVFTDPKALPGSYQVFAHLFNNHGQEEQTRVSGIVMYRDGTLPLPGITVRVGESKTLMATIQVDRDGYVTVLPP